MNNYYVVQEFMVKELKLKGLQKEIYAIIYGFTQDNETKFCGGLNYLSEWTLSSKQAVISALRELIEKGLIIKTDRIINGINLPLYHSSKLNTIKETLIPIKESLIKNNNINKESNTKVLPKKFVRPSLEEIKVYCSERKNSIDPVKFFDYYEAQDWKDSTGKPVKNWKGKVIIWESRNTQPKKQERSKICQNDEEWKETDMRKFI